MSYGRRVNFRPPLLDVLIAAAFVVMTVAEAVLNPDRELAGRARRGGRSGDGLAGLAPACADRRRGPGGGVQHRSSTRRDSSRPCSPWSWSASRSASRPGHRSATWGWLWSWCPSSSSSIVQTLEPSDLAAALVFFAGPWTVGVVLSGRMATAELAVARADQLEREREQESARAAAEERTRIARELHDIVSHSISVVTIQTQAVRRRLGPDHAAEAADLAAVEATAREAMAEMRRLFGMLRTEGERPGLALAPQPGLGELERLVRQVDSAGDDGAPEHRGRPGPAQPGRRPRGVPDRPGGAHQRPAARRRHPRGPRTGALLAPAARRRGGGQRSRSARTSSSNGGATAAGTGWSASASGWRSTAGPSTSRPVRPAAGSASP